MKNLLKFGVLVICITFFLTELIGQDFHTDGSMKLSEVSTNKNYGYESNHKTSIKVGSVKNQYAYLKALRGPNGERVQYNRQGSCCAFKYKRGMLGKGLLDRYEVYYDGLKEPIILYLNGYEFENPKAPVGFTFVREDKIEKPIVFPEDSIVRVNYCNYQSVFIVDKETLLKERIGEKPIPDTNPIFEGGIDELLKYFADRPLTDERANNMLFRVTIAFVVDCNGNAGNFMIISRGKGILETFANQVLERVNSMPQNWLPATKKGEKVDCYQVLSFSILDGKLNNVYYR